MYLETDADLPAAEGKKMRSANRVSLSDLESKIDELTAGDDEESKEMRRRLKQQARSKIQGEIDQQDYLWLTHVKRSAGQRAVTVAALLPSRITYFDGNKSCMLGHPVDFVNGPV